MSNEKHWTHAAAYRNNVPWTYDGINTAMLIAILEELKTLNRLLHCSNFTGIPQTLRKIDANTKKRKRVKPKLKAVA